MPTVVFLSLGFDRDKCHLFLGGGDESEQHFPRVTGCGHPGLQAGSGGDSPPGRLSRISCDSAMSVFVQPQPGWARKLKLQPAAQALSVNQH